MNNKLKSRIIADSYNSWLIIENDKEVCSHSLSMMEGVEGFCSLDYKEEEESFHINISKYLSLRVLLNSNINEKTLFSLVMQAIDMRIEAIKFLLPTEGIVYDLDLSFFELETRRLHMVFLPNRETSGERDFIDWLKELIELSSLKEGCEEAKSILRYLESEEYSLFSLKQRVKLALEKEDSNMCSPNSPAHGEGVPNVRGQAAKGALYLPKKQALRDLTKSCPDSRDVPSPARPKALQDHTKPPCIKLTKPRSERPISTCTRPKLEKSPSTSTEASKKEPRKPLNLGRLAPVLSQLALVLLYLACCFILKERVEPFYKLALGLFILFGLVDYLLLKFLYKNGYTLTKKEENKTKNEKIARPEKKSKAKKSQNKSNSPIHGANFEDDNRTLCLYDMCFKQMALVNKQNGDIVLINKQDYKIGRQGYEADLSLNDKSVGRLHAFIREEGDHYYLIDNASVNGTFINGIRLNPGEYNEILEGDEILFSRILFQFSALDC